MTERMDLIECMCMAALGGLIECVGPLFDLLSEHPSPVPGRGSLTRTKPRTRLTRREERALRSVVRWARQEKRQA